MENFFNWMSKPIPKDEVLIWFNVHNLNYEKIELYEDFSKSLYLLVKDTYLGDDSSETKITLSFDDKEKHFDWCWNKLIENFKQENLNFKFEGQHKDYFKTFYLDTFYGGKDHNLKVALPDFINDVFDLEKTFTKSDLDLLTEIYNLLDKNME